MAKKHAKKKNGARREEESGPDPDLCIIPPPAKPLRSRADVARYLEDELAVWFWALADLAHCGIHVSSDMFSDLANIAIGLARVLETGQPSRFDDALNERGVEGLARLVREFSASIIDGHPHARLELSGYEESERSLPALATALGRAAVRLREEQKSAAASGAPGSGRVMAGKVIDARQGAA